MSNGRVPDERESKARKLSDVRRKSARRNGGKRLLLSKLSDVRRESTRLLSKLGEAR